VYLQRLLGPQVANIMFFRQIEPFLGALVHLPFSDMAAGDAL